MVQLKVVVLLAALGLALMACSHDNRPANDASGANAADTAVGGGPSGNNVPTDESLGTGMPADSSISPGTGSTSPNESGSGTSPKGSGSNGH
jgi:hypothetical protein